MESLSTSIQFSLLKEKLPEALVLVKVHGFNMETLEKEMAFVFTDVDLEQFKVRQKLLSSSIYVKQKQIQNL